MLEVKDFTITIGDRNLIKNFNLVLNRGDKLAIIGEEGNGKSTLLKSILGICDYARISGTVKFKGNNVGYLEQSISGEDLNKTVKEFLFDDEYDYYAKVNDFYRFLDIFNLTEDILKQDVKTLSGGEKVKIGIFRILLRDPDIYFLDEPTNDLDIETLEWLEEFINNNNKPIIYISHDETLLSNTANMILHLEQLKKKTDSSYTLLRITYDRYVEQRLRKIEKQTQIAKGERREADKKQERLRKIMQKVEHEQNTISRGNPFGAAALKVKMRSLKAQEKRLENTEFTDIPDPEESINFFFEDTTIPRNKKIVEVDIPELKVEDKVLSRNIKLSVVGNTHMCIIGRNGVGKSTLIKIIYDKIKDRNDINVGYMPQNYDDILGKYKSVLDFVCPNGNKEEITRARMYLGNMKFTRDEMTGRISDISNGTKAKLFLIKLVLDKCNVLILDEPTRNVSPLSNPVIRNVLKEFGGTIISVSHDRKYLDEVVDTLYILTEDGLVKRD